MLRAEAYDIIYFKFIQQMNGTSTMVVRIGCMYADDWDFNTYEEGERIEIGRDAEFECYLHQRDGE